MDADIGVKELGLLYMRVIYKIFFISKSKLSKILKSPNPLNSMGSMVINQVKSENPIFSFRF